MLHYVFLKSHHDSPCLLGLGATPTTQVDIGLWNIKLLKKSLAHLLVIMLTRMNKAVLDIPPLRLCLLDSMNERGYLHEIRACTRNKGDMSHNYLNLN